MSFRTIESILAYQNANRMKESEKDMRYSDPNVCRLFLERVCPHTLLRTNVRTYGKECPNVHSLHLREAYEIAGVMCNVSYDRDVEDTLLEIIQKRDLAYQTKIESLKDADAEATKAISVFRITQNHEVLLLSNYIEQYSSIAEKYFFETINAKDLEMADEAMSNQAKVKKRNKKIINERAQKEAKLLCDALKEYNRIGRQKGGSSSVKIDRLVCDVCGTLFYVRDSANHFSEELHQGYLKIHYRLVDIQFERKAGSRPLPNEERPDMWWNEIDRRLLAPPTPVENQKNTNICWTVAPADACSSFLSQEGETVVLSPTPLIDTCCSSTRSTFVDVGYKAEDAFEHIKREGLPLISEVPFSRVKFPAGWRWDISQERIRTRRIPNYTRVGVDEESLITWLRFNSLAVCVFMNAYDGKGMYMGLRAYQVRRELMRHVVVLDGCGYDSRSNLNFFRYKNSLGKDWGEDGYGMMVRKSSMPRHRFPIIVDAYAPSFMHW